MDINYVVRIMSSEIRNLKNVRYGKIPYMNYSSLNQKGEIEKTDIVGIYGQNGSGKTALVESFDILKCILSGKEIPYEQYGGIFNPGDDAEITTVFYIEHGEEKYKAEYTVTLRLNEEKEKIEVPKEKLTYYKKGASWKAERELSFLNPFYKNDNILALMNLSVASPQLEHFTEIPFLSSMQNLALLCSQNCTSVFFNTLVCDSLAAIPESPEVRAFFDIIEGLMQFAICDLSVIQNMLLDEDAEQTIPVHLFFMEGEKINEEIIHISMNGVTEIKEEFFAQAEASIAAINIAIKAIVPDLQIELVKTSEVEKPDGSRSYYVEAYAIRNGKRFLVKHESEGIKRIISIINYLVSVFNDQGSCLVVDELDSGMFEYLLGELLDLLGSEMKGQIIFTSHNLRILEKLDAKNIVCTTTNPDNRYIRLTGIEKNHNKRDFYIRAITVGGQKEELYDEEDLLAMGYAFRKAGKVRGACSKLRFSPEFEKKLREAEGGCQE